ncbi:MAG: hypothetical protein AABX01_03260 [Candidatus Micrarchaeota archaeon]
MGKIIMVTKAGQNFQCEECKLLYPEKEWAEKCEAWCKKYNACSLEITSHSLKQTSK